jgi:endonuclease-8
MPEGDTTFRAARTLHRALSGQAITGFETAYAHLARVDEDAPIVGRRVDRVEARGKHLLVWLSGVPGGDALVLRTHMRMSGSWHIYRTGEGWRRSASQARIVIRTAAWTAVAFSVAEAEFIAAGHLERHARLRRLGPDLLSPDFDAAAAVANLRALGPLSIGEALLRQHAIAGAGNVFKSEVLFLCRVNPTTKVAVLTDRALHAVVDRARALLAANVTDASRGGIVTFTGLRRTTRRSDPGARLWVYGRGGQACRACGTPIASFKQGGEARVTYWCPSCQSGDHDG